MSDYWLGVVTLPAIGLVGFLLLVLWERSMTWLSTRGVTFSMRWDRDASGISEYTLRNNVWWERSFGPVFGGGWYREIPTRKFNRWVGVGRADGPCFCAFLSRDLGEK